MNTILKVAAALIAIMILLTLAVPAKSQTPLTAPREIYLVGPITDTMAIVFRDQLKSLNNLGNDMITVHITSYGGAVYAGLQIYDYMMQSKAPIHTICEGYCMSMAAILLIVGDERESNKSATILFHEVGFGAQGKLTEVQHQVDEAQRLQAVIDRIIMTHSGLSADEVSDLESYDDYMSSQEALDLGLIDLITARREEGHAE